MITDQPGACMGSQARSKCDIIRLHAKRKLQVKLKGNTSMHQAITDISFLTHQPFCSFLQQKVIGRNVLVGSPQQ